ncbi:spore germination lipoprotein GerD [Pradoshia sp.]
MYKKALGVAIACCSLALASGCSEGNKETNADSYSDDKKMMVDLLKTDEGKKAIQEALEDKDVKAELIMDQDTVTKTIKETLTSKEEMEFWKNAFSDPEFVKALAKGMKSSHKDILKDLMKDPEYISLMTNILKSSDMQKEFISVLKEKDVRKEIKSLVTETLENPLYQEQISDILLKAATEKSTKKSSDGSQSDQSEPSQ